MDPTANTFVLNNWGSWLAHRQGQDVLHGKGYRGMELLAALMQESKEAVVEALAQGLIFEMPPLTPPEQIFNTLFKSSERLYATNECNMIYAAPEPSTLADHLQEAGQALALALLWDSARRLLGRNSADLKATEASKLAALIPELPDYLQSWDNKSHATFALVDVKVTPEDSRIIQKPAEPLMPGKSAALSWVNGPLLHILSGYSGTVVWGTATEPGAVGSGQTFAVRIGRYNGVQAVYSLYIEYQVQHAGAPPAPWIQVPAMPGVEGVFEVEWGKHAVKVTVKPLTGGAWDLSVGVTIEDALL